MGPIQSGHNKGLIIVTLIQFSIQCTMFGYYFKRRWKYFFLLDVFLAPSFLQLKSGKELSLRLFSVGLRKQNSELTTIIQSNTQVIKTQKKTQN
jgi:hypothetical protein